MRLTQLEAESREDKNKEEKKETEKDKEKINKLEREINEIFKKSREVEDKIDMARVKMKINKVLEYNDGGKIYEIDKMFKEVFVDSDYDTTKRAIKNAPNGKPLLRGNLVKMKLIKRLIK